MTLFEFTKRMVGEIQELPGGEQHPYIQWCLMLCKLGSNQPDEVPWCSAFLNERCWQLGLPCTYSAAARSWLLMPVKIALVDVKLGDIVFLKRGTGNQPGPDVIQAPGHVGLFADFQAPDKIQILAGNQGNTISIAPFPVSQILGIRRVGGPQ